MRLRLPQKRLKIFLRILGQLRKSDWLFLMLGDTSIETCTQTFVNILHSAFQYIMNIKGKKHVLQNTEIPQ